MSTITIREVPIEQVVEITKSIVEFDQAFSKDYFEKRYQNQRHLIIAGFVHDQPAGYIVAYDRDHDGSLYCWMAGVIPAFRRLGVLSKLMDYQSHWAKSAGYTKIKIKTRNNRREMLANVVKRGFMVTQVKTQPDVRDNRIELEISI